MPHVDDSATPDPPQPVASRRTFMLAGVGLLIAGCGPAVRSVSLPGPAWKPRTLAPIEEAPAAVATGPAILPGNVLARSQWAGGPPVPSLMQPMLPVQFITVHHDGMDPFYGNEVRHSVERLERIRRSHRQKEWGDIGYHFCIDRDGRIWQGRPLNWQGAHVKDRNEGNIGVLVMGNFDRQAPTPPQLASLNRHVSAMMRQYDVPLSRVRTHQEWASTACPGAHLQRYMAAVRNNRQLG